MGTSAKGIEGTRLAKNIKVRKICVGMVISGSRHKRKPFRVAKYEDARQEEKKQRLLITISQNTFRVSCESLNHTGKKSLQIK